jgi:uncharacterized MAPEG superfamily protein
MTPELTILVLAALWQGVHFVTYSLSAQAQVGTDYAASPRDEPVQLTGRAGRLQRAMNNHFEGLLLFTIAVVALEAGGQGTAATTAYAIAYLAARVLYLPAYAYGWTPWRSVIWIVGFLATIAMLVMALI